ncbi:class I SAM-dependent methyltransferase [Gloeocapsa sp. PCC 73106]|uniref:class I SAM-dependent methyltransferase n=1 Tax=Gloeocapsa sp. PCC 73106 TaxID=102232 RepID=UPI0002ACE013|nr:class I SAM-dependent methyltransferase [Gloeocapsa sp. PCC 73106]ELR98875.1 methylase involved in ubiquinone/menaquinone biosynthesis [Gloeocapsa sp. PCC 73106]
MATILRRWSYQYPPLYDSISGLAALPLGGNSRFRRLALTDLSIQPDTQVLDLCCGSGQTTGILTQFSHNVTGLDISPVALARAQQKVPQAKYIEGLAQAIPVGDQQFDLVHTSVALHEMTQTELTQIFAEVYRVLKPGGIFAFIDLHPPTNWLFWPPLAIFCWLFETETAWELLNTDLAAKLESAGFNVLLQQLYLGGSLQVSQSQKKK